MSVSDCTADSTPHLLCIRSYPQTISTPWRSAAPTKAIVDVFERADDKRALMIEQADECSPVMAVTQDGRAASISAYATRMMPHAVVGTRRLY